MTMRGVIAEPLERGGIALRQAIFRVDSQRQSAGGAFFAVDFVAMRRVRQEPSAQRRRGGRIHLIHRDEQPLPTESFAQRLDAF